MTRSILLSTALAVPLIALAEEKTDVAPATSSTTKLVVALKPDKNPDALQAERQDLREFLTRTLKRPVEVTIPSKGSIIIEGMAAGAIDLAYLSSTDMVSARDSKVANILVAGEIDGKPSYQSYWLTLKDKPYTSIAALKGKPVAFAGRTSTSGYIIPLYDLHMQGLLPLAASPESFFGKGNVLFGEGYVSAVEKVLTGEAEAAAVSDYVMNKNAHLTAEQRSRLKKFDEQGPVPSHAIAVRSGISSQERAELLAAVLSLNEEPHTALRDKVFTSKLIEVDEGLHLAPIAAALSFAKQTP